MAKTIDQLTLLSTLPDDSDLLPISDNGVTKRVASGVLKSDCLRTVSNTVTVPDATNFALNATTGTKLGTDATQKLAFWNATPVDQPALTADLLDSLQEVGLIASGSESTPLNLSSGTLTCGPVNCSTLAASSNATVGGNATIGGNLSANGDMTFGEGKNVVAGTATGTKIGTATTQRLGFWNATPVVQPTAITSLDVTASAGSLPTANGSVSVNATTPTVNQLLEFCVELQAKQNAILSRLRTIGIIAT